MSNIPRNDDDQLETRLRRALNSEAAMAQPAGDGLTKIREGIDARRRRAWWRNPALALVAAAVLGVAVGGLYFGSRDNGTTTLPPATSTSPSATSSGTSSPTPSTSESTDPSPSDDDAPSRLQRAGLRLLHPRRRREPSALPRDPQRGGHRFQGRGRSAGDVRRPAGRSRLLHPVGQHEAAFLQRGRRHGHGRPVEVRRSGLGGRDEPPCRRSSTR